MQKISVADVRMKVKKWTDLFTRLLSIKKRDQMKQCCRCLTQTFWRQPHRRAFNTTNEKKVVGGGYISCKTNTDDRSLDTLVFRTILNFFVTLTWISMCELYLFRKKTSDGWIFLHRKKVQIIDQNVIMESLYCTKENGFIDCWCWLAFKVQRTLCMNAYLNNHYVHQIHYIRMIREFSRFSVPNDLKTKIRFIETERFVILNLHSSWRCFLTSIDKPFSSHWVRTHQQLRRQTECSLKWIAIEIIDSVWWMYKLFA